VSEAGVVGAMEAPKDQLTPLYQVCDDLWTYQTIWTTPARLQVRRGVMQRRRVSISA